MPLSYLRLNVKGVQSTLDHVVLRRKWLARFVKIRVLDVKYAAYPYVSNTCRASRCQLKFEPNRPMNSAHNCDIGDGR